MFLQFNSPILDVWWLNGGQLKKIVFPTNTASVHPSLLLGSYEGQIYIHPTLPEASSSRLQLIEAEYPEESVLFEDIESLKEYTMIQPECSTPSTSNNYQLAIYRDLNLLEQLDQWKEYKTEGPVGKGVYFGVNDKIDSRAIMKYIHPVRDICTQDGYNDESCEVSTSGPVARIMKV